jgi:hypothetical protein
MSNQEEAWQQFLDSHEDFEQEFAEEFSEDDTTPEKQYGLTLFDGEPGGYFMVFNTQIDIFQFVRLLRYFFGIDGVDIGHSGGNGHHYHNISNEDDDENDDE